MNFRDKKVLITGGLGFLGSNLALRLVELGTKVTLVDNLLPRQGGNLFNIEPIQEKVAVNISDIRNQLSMNHLVKDQDFIFHLAGQVNHVDSMRNPLNDLSINVEGTLSVLEACRQFNPTVKILFSGTRGQYGSTVCLPVGEEHPMHPKGVYALTNLCAENLMMVYHDVHHIRSICFRITNTYGPRHQMAHDEYGVVNWFIRKAIDGDTIPVFGDGRILRDYLCVEDCVEAFIQAMFCEKAYGQVFNVGTGVPINFIELAEKIKMVASCGKVEFTEFTKERKEVEPGDYYADISKIKKIVGWQPKISFEQGLKETVEYYRKYKKYYWE